MLIGNQFYSAANLRLFVVTNYVISWSSDITFPPKSAFYGSGRTAHDNTDNGRHQGD